MPFRPFHALVASAALALAFPAAAQGAGPSALGGLTLYRVDVDQFESALTTSLDATRSMGYQYAIYKDDVLVRSGARGVAALSATPWVPSTNAPMTLTRRLDVASMSKTLTAAAVVKAIEELQAQGKAVSLDSKIAPYLPSNWSKGWNVQNLTFRQVLAHTGGVRASGNTYAELQAMVAMGCDPATVGKWDYQNSDYALLRVALAYLTAAPGTFAFTENYPSLNATATATVYRNYIRTHLLAPLGFGDADIVYTGPKPDSAYFQAYPATYDWRIDPTDSTNLLTAGPGCWNLSAIEFGKFIAALRLGKLVSPAGYAAMAQAVPTNAAGVGLGMYGIPGTLGTTWCHNGEGCCGYGPTALWLTTANGYTVVYVSNTAASTAPNAYALQALFDASIKAY